jgi:hypothetical protein
MDLIISETVRAKFPDLRIGIVVARNLDNTQYPEALASAVKLAFTSFVPHISAAVDSYLMAETL